MADKAEITSIEALDSFRASLIIFLSKARRAVDDSHDSIRRTRVWLQHDQKTRWETETRRREGILNQAEQELLSARISGLRETAPVQQAAVRKARESLEFARGKTRKVKQWNQDYDGKSEPLARAMSSLRQFLEKEIPEGIAFLSRAQTALEAYAEVHVPVAPGKPASSALEPAPELSEPA